MATPEGLRKSLKTKQLETRIVRAESWRQLLPTEEVAQKDFRTNLVDAYRFYYGKDNPKVIYVVESDSDGDIHRVTRDKGYDTTYQRLQNGNVRIVSYFPHKPESVALITPGIGNIDHPYTQRDLITIIDESGLAAIRSERDALIVSWLKGKPATQGWEDTMLRSGHLPQRIGHRLFPHTALDRLNHIKKRYPQLIAVSSVDP